MICDKCSKPIALQDDATALEAEAINCPAVVFYKKPRHIQCSPSRAQYIVHPDFPPVIDDRPEFDKRLKPPEVVAEQERKWTDVWVRVREEKHER